MTPCPRCGRPFPDDAAYCPACGAARAWQPAPPLGQRLAQDTQMMEALILAGAIVCFVVAGFVLVMGVAGMASLAAFEDFMWEAGGPRPPIPMGAFVGFFVVVGLLDIAWGVLAMRARSLVRSGDVRGGGKLAIVSGALMTVLGVGLLGLLVLIPGILVFARASQPAAPAMPVAPR